jgi:hypothetical protein
VDAELDEPGGAAKKNSEVSDDGGKADTQLRKPDFLNTLLVR